MNGESPKLRSWSKGKPPGGAPRLFSNRTPLIFTETEVSFEILAQRMRELAFLNRGVRIDLSDERIPKERSFCYEGGLVSFIEYLEQKQGAARIRRSSTVAGDRQNVGIETAIQYNNTYVEKIFTFANNINTKKAAPTWPVSKPV